MGGVYRIVCSSHDIQELTNAVLGLLLEIINQSVRFSHIQHNSNHKQKQKNGLSPFAKGIRVKGQVHVAPALVSIELIFGKRPYRIT
jgi:hypothetical protein